MANDQPFDITDDAELHVAVRNETDYDDDQLPTKRLDGLVQSAKRLLALRADVTDFYNDRGLTVALHGVTCIKTKAHVENVAVRAKNLGAQDVTFRSTDGDSLQIAQYEEMVQRGLAESDKTEAGTKDLVITGDYLHD